MIGIVALLVVVALAVVLWRTVAASRDANGSPSTPDQLRLRSLPTRRPGRRRDAMVPPDDAPEFLAELSRRARRDDDSTD